MFKRLLTGSVLSVVAMLSNIVVAMAMMPFIIHSLGNHDYGLWILVASFVGYYGLLDFGMSTAVTRFISRADGQGDVDEMNTILNTASVFFAGLGLFIFLISVIVAVSVSNTTTAILWLTVGVTCIFQFGLRGFYGVFFARIRQDIISVTAMAKLFLRTAAIVYFLSTGYGVIAVAVITMVAEILFYAIDMFILSKIAPDMKLSWEHVDRKRVKEMIDYGKFSMIIQIADLLRLRALPVIVTYAVGIPFIVFFSIAIRLMEIYYQVVEKVIHILVPVFSQHESRGEKEKIKRMFWIAFRINLVVSFFIFGGLLIFSEPFIAWWIGAEYTLAGDLTMWLAVGFLAFTINQAGKTALFGVSKHQLFAWMSAWESVMGAVWALIFGALFGPIYIAVTIVIVMLIVELTIKPYIICIEMELSYAQYTATMLEVAAWFIMPIFLGFILLHGWVDSISSIIAGVSAYTAACLPIIWLSLDEDTKEILHRKIISRLPVIGGKCTS